MPWAGTRRIEECEEIVLASPGLGYSKSDTLAVVLLSSSLLCHAEHQRPWRTPASYSFLHAGNTITRCFVGEGKDTSTESSRPRIYRLMGVFWSHASAIQIRVRGSFLPLQRHSSTYLGEHRVIIGWNWAKTERRDRRREA
jgi:hypothetical protein